MNMGDSDEEEKPWSEQSNNASEIAEVSNRNSSEQEIVDLDNIEKYFELLPQGTNKINTIKINNS